MTFPLNSPERASLIPVISTLLQFNAKELVEVDRAAKDPAWNSRPVKEIKRSLDKASLPNATTSISQKINDNTSAVRVSSDCNEKNAVLNLTSVSQAV